MKKHRRGTKFRNGVAVSAVAVAVALTGSPVFGSAASLSGTPFAVKATNSQDASRFAVRPLLAAGKPSTPTPTPTPTPNGPALDPGYPAATASSQFTFALNADGKTANLTSFAGTAKDVVIPQTATISGTERFVTSIASSTFKSKALTSIVIPDGVTSIGASAFYGNNFSTVKLPSGLQSLENSVFENTPLASIAIPSSVKTIGNYAFSANRLTSVVIPDSVTSIGIFAFQSNQLTSLKLSNSLTSIPARAFFSNAITEVTIPNGVTSIGEAAFRGNKLTSVTLSSSLQTIGLDAFYANTNTLTSVTIPAGVTSIGTDAFGGPTPIVLTKIYMEGNAPTTFTGLGGSYPSFGVFSGKTIYYHASATGYSSPTWKGYTTATY